MKVINMVSRVLGYVAMVIVLAMMLLTFGDVFLRYAFRSPIVGTMELTEMMMASLLLALAWCAVEGRHVSIGLLMSRVPSRAQAAVDSFTLLAGLGIYIILVWQGYLAALFSHSYDVSTSLLDVPVSPFHLLFSLSFAMLCIAILSLLIQRIAKVVKG